MPPLILGIFLFEDQKLARDVIDYDIEHGADRVFHDELIYVKKRDENEFRSQTQKERKNARGYEFKKLRNALCLFCFYENEIFACPESKQHGCRPCNRVGDRVGKAVKKGKMGKIGKKSKKKSKNDPVHDGRAAADEKVNDLLSVFRQAECFQYDVDGFIDESDEKTAVVLFQRIFRQERYVLSR